MTKRRYFSLQLTDDWRTTYVWDEEGRYMDRIGHIYLHWQAGKPVKGYLFQDVTDENGKLIKVRRGYKTKKIYFTVSNLRTGHTEPEDL